MDYRGLIFYQKAREVVKAINAEIKRWSPSPQAQTISRQLFRASTSVGANISEGHGRHEGLEYIHFLLIAQGSANEVDHWLNTSIDCGIGDPLTLKSIINLNTETRKMLTSTISTLQKKRAENSLRESPPPYSPILYSPDEDGES